MGAMSGVVALSRPRIPHGALYQQYGLFAQEIWSPLAQDRLRFLDFFNLLDKNHRGVGWGIDAPGRGLTVRYRLRF
jgi:hypothetical protein